MPPKKKVQAPIDRPLSRAYLREFSGWSTAYPPGLSDPTSLRIMENVMINRDGSARVRPGLRYLSYSTPPTETTNGVAITLQPVGTHEAFFLADGTKAYLFAVREADESVGFRVLVLATSGAVVRTLDAAGVGFSLPSGASLNFTSRTTYVKYLQIDNKIFALSDAGEPMRLFTVGVTKLAKTLAAISQPEWTVEDKLTVVHPLASWITTAVPASYRSNLLLNPAFETGVHTYSGSGCTIEQSATFARTGTYSAKITGTPQRVNYLTNPLTDTAVYPLTGWTVGPGTDNLVATGGIARAIVAATPGPISSLYSPHFAIPAGSPAMHVEFEFDSIGVGAPGVVVYFYNAAHTQIGWNYSDSLIGMGGGRYRSPSFTPTAGTVYMSIQPYVDTSASGSGATWDISDVVVTQAAWDASELNGDMGADYFWDGTAGLSSSRHHPPSDISVGMTSPMSVAAGVPYSWSVYSRSGSAARTMTARITWLNSSYGFVSYNDGSPIADATGAWNRATVSATAPAGAVWAILFLIYEDVPRNESHYIDNAMLEAVASPGAYYDGSTTSTSTLVYSWSGTPHNSSSIEVTYSLGVTIPTANTPTDNTLISDGSPNANSWSFGFFYTFSNEIGESAASQVTIVKTQRGWSQWRWETPNGAGEPSGTGTSDPAAVAEGATAWNLYMFTWSDQDAVPVSAVRIGTKEIPAGGAHGTYGWIRATPVVSETGEDIAVLPNLANRYNYSDPSRGGTGIVAADRMVVVKDPTAAAVVRWSSGQQGDYSNFTAAKGGGYKTLTSGNLMMPACVKLWQNPQSADTLTVLCVGTDGHSTGYYMAPAQIASQSEATNIMSFEETTATPGTVSPYGCEVFNNALYHPLDDQLMKSTANNYNIAHKTQTEAIRNVWERLNLKGNIVSSQHDGRLYYIVNNPDGLELAPGCMGNEVWVFDATAETGTWSRWLVQAHSLRKIEMAGRVYMSVVTALGIMYFDPEYAYDDTAAGLGQDVTFTTIPWSLETNTQGANRAHDAWANLQQLDITFGNFIGTLRYGVRGFDQHGRAVEVSKLVSDEGADLSAIAQTWDLEDYLLVRRQMKEWFFFAESVVDEDGDVVHSEGQINAVQYRYTPISVNIGYEYGNVETFEYGKAAAGEPSITTNGTPVPMIDTRRP